MTLCPITRRSYIVIINYCDVTSPCAYFLHYPFLHAKIDAQLRNLSINQSINQPINQSINQSPFSKACHNAGHYNIEEKEKNEKLVSFLYSTRIRKLLTIESYAQAAARDAVVVGGCIAAARPTLVEAVHAVRRSTRESPCNEPLCVIIRCR